MPFEYRGNDFTSQKLIRIYKAFCRAYDLPIKRDDVKFLRHSGLRLLQSGGLEHKIGQHANFRARVNGDELYFSGNNAANFPEHLTRDNDFRMLALEYLKD